MPIVLSLTGHLELGDRKLSRSEARDWLARAAVWFEGVGDALDPFAALVPAGAAGDYERARTLARTRSVTISSRASLYEALAPYNCS